MTVLTVLLATSASWGQPSEDSETSARSILKNAINHTLSGNHSFTTDLKQSNRMKYSSNRMTVHQKQTISLKFVPPLMSGKATTKMSMERGAISQSLKKQVIRMVGRNGSNPQLYVKIDEAPWTSLKSVAGSQRIRRRMTLMFTIRTYSNFLQTVQVQGHERVHKRKCRKVTGKLDLERFQSHLHQQLRGMFEPSATGGEYGFSLDLKKAEIQFWIEKDPTRIRRFSLSYRQEITYSGGNKEDHPDMTLLQQHQQKIDYRRYDNTEMPRKEKERFQTLSSKEASQNRPDESGKENSNSGDGPGDGPD